MSIVRCTRALGLRVDVVDLGAAEALYSEYDGRARAIRVSARHLRALHGAERRRFFVHAVAHELYHHFERIGAVKCFSSRARREAAAERFAQDLGI